MDNLASFTDILGDEIPDSQQSQPMSLPSPDELEFEGNEENTFGNNGQRPAKGTGQYEQFRCVEEIDPKYRRVFTYPYFNLVQSNVIEDALYSDKSMVVCAPTGSGKTVIFEMAIVQLLMDLEDKRYTGDFKIIYMAPVKALCTERLSEWYPKFTKLGLLCIVVTGDTDVDFSQLKPYRIIITTPEKWDMLTRRWRDHRSLVEVIKLFLIDEVHILNDESRGPALEVVVSRMKTIESSAQSACRIEQLQRKYQGSEFVSDKSPPRIRFVAVSATVGNPEDVASWIGDTDNPAVFYKFGDECRPVKVRRVVEGYPCSEGTSIFKFDIILNYKLWPIIQKYHNGKPTLIFCNTRKSVILTAEMLSRELTINFSPEQKAKLIKLASTLKNKKLQSLILSGVGCHHAGLLFEERTNIEQSFRNRDLPILITTTTLAMGVNLPAHLVIIKNTQQYVNGAYQEYSISTVLQMVGRAGRPQYDTEATAVIMTRLADKPRYLALVGGSEPLQSYLHKRLPENLNSEAALGTVTDVAQCVQWLRSTFLWVRARRDPKRYLGLPATASQQLITKKIEELCVKAMNGLASTGLITMDEASCIESTEAGRLMSIYYIDLETMKHIMKIEGDETLERLLYNIICESKELADMHLRVDERRLLNALNRNRTASTIRYPMKGKITTRQMKLNCIIQAVLGCLTIPDPSLNQEAMKVMRLADRICKCLVAYVTRPSLISQQPQFYTAVLNSLVLAKCISAQLWENSPFISRQLKGIGPTLSSLLASAGKVNFLMLKESHPRDLERIMNKGPPAGNVLLKQVCLLPKYLLTVTEVDERTRNIRLVLQNISYLSDNLDHLTAGDTHKCYIVVGDSENNILLLTSFKDKELITGIYAGSITHKITRKCEFEHKIYAHCISSNFVGIDEHCEHIFQDIRPEFSRLREDTAIKTIDKKQTLITDNFHERKRKNQNDITEPKEKIKRRDSPIIEKFKCLKESLTVSSNKCNKNLNNTMKISDTTKCYNNKDIPGINPTKIIDNKDATLSQAPEIPKDDPKPNQLVDDHDINCLLNEIENEILKRQKKSTTSVIDNPKLTLNSPVRPTTKAPQQNILPTAFKTKCEKISSQSIKQLYHYKDMKQKVRRNQKHNNLKTNFSFIDSLEKNISCCDDEENIQCKDDAGFSNAIKYRIDNYLKKTTCNSTHSNAILNKMLETSEDIESLSTDTRECKYEHSIHDKDNISEGLNIKTTLDVNNISKEVDQEMYNENDNIDNINDKMNLENIPYHVNAYSNLCNEQTQNNVTLCNTLDIPNNVQNAVNYHNENDNKIISLTEGVHKTLESFITSDITNNENADVTVSPCILEASNNEMCREIVPLNKTINSMNCIDKSNKIETEINRHSTGYVKQYTCTSTKIDLCTRNINDQVIHVVRKLTMDFDITEAVYNPNDCNNKNGINIENDISEVSILSNCTTLKNKLQNISDSILLPNDKIHELEEINKMREDNLESFSDSNPDNLPHLLKEIEHMRVYNKDHKPVVKNVCSNINKKKSNFDYRVNNKEILGELPIERLQNDFSFIDLRNVQQNSHSNVNECKTAGTFDELQTLTDKNTISDILKKYRNHFCKHLNERHIANRNLCNVINAKDNTITLKKTRKPFKISEIDKVRVSLPNILVDVTPTQSLSISESPIKDTTYNDEACNKNQLLVTPPPPPPTFREECLNINIDQSMFDPKTLLLCLGKENKDEEIIPPPPEYRDNLADNINTHLYDFNDYSPNIDNLSKYEDLHDITAAEHSSEAPSEKTEYWILSQDDYNSSDLKQDIVMPYTVKNLKSPGNKNKTVLGHTLEQFKFQHKEIMKMNKDLDLNLDTFN